MKQRLVGFLLLLATVCLFHAGTARSAAAQTTSAGTTWYIRADGGTRWSANRVSTNGPGGLNYSTLFTAQCDGQHDAPFPAPGTINVLGVKSNGINQPCAFNDYRFLWDDQTYQNDAWVIAGGDTVIIRGGPWRVGFDPGTPAHQWCYGGSGSIQCVNPTIPSGSASQHTRILGENFGACHTGDSAGVGGTATRAKMTQIFGGMGAYTPMNIGGAKYLDISCLEITRHSQCITGGMPRYPSTCNVGTDDFDADGIEEDNQTSNVTMTDLWVHGNTGRGVKGPIGGPVVANRVTLGYNGAAGWDFDNGNGGASDALGPNASWTFAYSTIEWSGCNQEYPIVHQYPAISCYGQQTQGYGDGVGTAPGQWLDVYIDHSTFRYNTQDGEDFGHMDGGTHVFHVTNSLSYGNGGGAFKWGWGFTDILFQNNLAEANCRRLAAPIGDAPYLANGTPLAEGDLCRSGDALSFNFEDNTKALFANNTIVSYASTTFDMKCVPIVNSVTGQNQSNCNNAVFTLKNNIILAYNNPVYDYNGSNAGPGLFCGASCNNTTYNIGTINRDHNIYFGIRNSCEANKVEWAQIGGSSTNEQCIDAKFVNEPAINRATFTEPLLDNYNFNLAANSPALHAGASVAGLLTDYNGFPYAAPPSMGAIEFGSVATTPPASTTPTLTALTFASPNPITLTIGASATPACTATFSDTSTSTCAAAGATFSSDASAFASASSGTLTAIAAGSGHLLANVGSIVGTDTFTVTAPSAPTVTSIAFSAINPITLTAGGSATPTCLVTWSNASTSTCTSAGVTFSTDAPSFATATSTGSLAAIAAGSGHLLAYLGSIVASDAFTITAPASNVSISINQPALGFHVIPRSTRRIFANVTNGTTNQVTWAVVAGSATISSSTGSWVDVTAGSAGSSCQINASGSPVTSAAQFTLEATSADDTTQKADVTVNICNPAVSVTTIPSYRTLYANQTADIQSLVVGAVNDQVQWAIVTQPSGGDGKLADATSRDTLFSATVPGRYTLSATSAADMGQVATTILYVTGHAMPYRVTPNQTEPVDCSVDPALTGTTFDVGPSQPFKHLAALPAITAGSTIRLHNEDTTGIAPTTFHEYVQLAQSATPDQPVRLCGVPDVTGRLPILDASKAVGPTGISSNTLGYGLITVGGQTSGAPWPTFNGAQNILIEGLHLRNAKGGMTYTTPSGTTAKWSSAAACINISDGHNISLIGNELDSCGNGANSAWNGNTWGGSSLNHLWEGNHIHGSGVTGSAAEHQMHLEAWGQVVQFNRIDRINGGALGFNLKSRGVHDVIRYNFFGDGPARDLDLVEVGPAAAQFMSFADFFSANASPTPTTYSMDQLAAWQEAWNSHFAYGNVYLNSTSTAPVHFAYDANAAEPARKGSLYWYNNTFYKTACATCSSTLWTMFDTGGANGSLLPQTEFQTVQVFNDLLWMDNATPLFQWNNFEAFIGVGASNLLPAGWGFDTLKGGPGDGWNDNPAAVAYQEASDLRLHITGFDSSSITTASSMPFDKTTWTLASAAPASTTLPHAVCQMPARFTFLPTLGYAIPRSATSNIGALDTASQTAANLSLVNTGATPAAATCP